MTKVRGNTASLRGLALRRAPEVELVDSAVRGDPAAFAEVYRRFHTPVYAFCLSRLLEPTTAEDAAQEVFVRLLSAEPGSISRPLPWLFGVARHVCIDASRRQSREIATELGSHELIDSFDTEQHVTAREDGARIAITLKGLNPRYRTALVMHEMHAQSATEIAKAFGIGLGATYTLLSRAREAFNSAYARAEEMSESCTQAIDILYRRNREGASQAEEVRLQQHLAECESCSREARRFARSERFAALRGAFALPVLSRWWTQSQHWLDPLISRVAPEAAHAAVASAVAAAIVLTAAVTTAPEPQAVGQDARSHVVESATKRVGVPVSSASAERSQRRQYERERAAAADTGRQPQAAGPTASSGESQAGARSGGASVPGSGGSSGSRAPSEPQREPVASGQPAARTTQKGPADTTPAPTSGGAAGPTSGGTVGGASGGTAAQTGGSPEGSAGGTGGSTD